MANSLQDQLLKAGLVDRKQAKKVKQEKRKAGKQGGTGANAANRSPARSGQASLEKRRRDRELNLRRKEAAQRKAVEAQVRQMVAANRESLEGGELSFHFQDGSKVKKIPVSEPIRQRLVAGRLGVVRLDEEYAVVPAEVAVKVKERSPGSLILLNEASPAKKGREENDPYAEYEVPDDMMW